jgi:hypothetical protein
VEILSVTRVPVPADRTYFPRIRFRVANVPDALQHEAAYRRHAAFRALVPVALEEAGFNAGYIRWRPDRDERWATFAILTSDVRRALLPFDLVVEVAVEQDAPDACIHAAQSQIRA